ncbi:patatin-like phospholipase family protein [Cupriavidus necator]|uniref:Patatin-like phospholipase family protein n=2 Tax=Cupriavidus necator TaxID=106590 RepID=A0A367PAF9_CUPNE|nr:patatin-like phospholipase family protein [Cupriavidus necator]QQX88964.1 patatin-like phospholipase family protein [Cupriavidus necator]RCJ04840.1 patatin-like phospholipase family protein [Cupriavidus necator]
MGEKAKPPGGRPAQAEGPFGELPGQVVLVLQGGGALGAYQAGVYQALHEAGLEPEWVIGTSIGAINGAIIAGNPPARRLSRLKEFWGSVAYRGAATGIESFREFDDWMRVLAVTTLGIPAFFTPSPDAWWLGVRATVGLARAAFYSTSPLHATLARLVDFDYLNDRQTRLTVGTVSVRSGRMRYFTNRDAPLNVDHMMASAAFPPGFPSVQIEGESYWDGGIYSNTPLEAILDDRPRRSSLIFAVQLWPASGPEPDSIWQVMSRLRDIQYSSRAESHLERQRQIHRLRHVIRELGKHIPESERKQAAVQELLDWGCGTTMHVVELDAPQLDGNDIHRDIDFSTCGIERRWMAGYKDTRLALERAPWRDPLDPIEGIAVHRIGVETPVASHRPASSGTAK